jgi:hypothetical protein
MFCALAIFKTSFSEKPIHLSSQSVPSDLAAFVLFFQSLHRGLKESVKLYAEVA